MIGYCNAVRKLEKHFEGLGLHHIPQLKNPTADDLSKIGVTWKDVPKNVFLEHLHSPMIKEDPFVEEPRNHSVHQIRLRWTFLWRLTWSKRSLLSPLNGTNPIGLTYSGRSSQKMKLRLIRSSADLKPSPSWEINIIRKVLLESPSNTSPSYL